MLPLAFPQLLLKILPSFFQLQLQSLTSNGCYKTDLQMNEHSNSVRCQAQYIVQSTASWCRQMRLNKSNDRLRILKPHAIYLLIIARLARINLALRDEIIAHVDYSNSYRGTSIYEIRITIGS